MKEAIGLLTSGLQLFKEELLNRKEFTALAWARAVNFFFEAGSVGIRENEGLYAISELRVPSYEQVTFLHEKMGFSEATCSRGQIFILFPVCFSSFSNTSS